MVLLVMLLVLNSAAILLRNRYQKTMVRWTTMTDLERKASEEAGGREQSKSAPDETEVVFEVDGAPGALRLEAGAEGTSTWSIYRNRVTALIGPSGCGKSTFLRCFNRMNDLIDGAQIEGDVLYHGDDLYGPDVDPVEVRRRIGMVFQKPNPFPKSIYDNVAFGPRIAGLQGRTRRAASSRACAQAALWDEVKDKLKRVGVRRSPAASSSACASRGRLAVEPDVILMDEPCSALDPDRDGADRGSDARAEARVHDRDRHAQHAAGRTCLRPHRVLHASRSSDEGTAPDGWSSTTEPRRSSPTRRTSGPRATSRGGSDDA